MTVASSQNKGSGPFKPFLTGRHGAVVLGPQWLERVRGLEIALQPLISVHSARCVGYEALLRGYEALGHVSAAAFLDSAEAEDALPEVEAALFEKAFDKFAGLPGFEDLKLFLNLDGRSLSKTDRLCPYLREMIAGRGITPVSVVLEVSERHPILASEAALKGIKALNGVVGKVAIDDFGTGYAGLPLLYYTQPDYVKIDAFFVHDAGRDSRKKMFLRQLVNIAHLLGLQVVAKGVETEAEYYVCKDVGCDLVQGFHIHRPAIHAEEAWSDGAEVARMNVSDRRGDPRSDHRLVKAQVDYIVPIDNTAELTAVFERFRHEQTSTFFPVVNDKGEPLGIVREQDLKTYAYSPFGKELLTNKGYGRQTMDFVWRCPIADISTKAEKILEIFSADETSEGILMVEDGRYMGFLSARSLLHILNEKNLALARDQNPLTKLPGNNMINEFLSGALADKGSSYLIAYIDFDNFKPFNDAYGFRLGDRAITLFATILNKDLPREGVFVGHVGGDDFFAAFRDLPFDEAQALVAHVIERFRQEVESFYTEEDRERGCIVAKDRHGIERCMPLLSASAAVVAIRRGHAPGSVDEISSVIARMKKEAKASPTKLAVATISSPQDDPEPSEPETT